MAEKGGNLVAAEEQIVITAEHVVTATGNHAQRTARLLGIKIPAIPVEHQFIVTEPDPALSDWRKASGRAPGAARCRRANGTCARSAAAGSSAPTRRRAGAVRIRRARQLPRRPVPARSGADRGRVHVDDPPDSVVGEVGLKDDFNGPICYTPDGNPLVGPAPGLSNMWLAEGFSFGITAAGGTGHYLAQMMVEGEAEIDMASLDPQPLRALDDHRIRGAEERGMPTPTSTSCTTPTRNARPRGRSGPRPAYDRQKATGAQFGCVNGWERPNYYGPPTRRRASTTTRAASAAAAGGTMRPRRRRRSARASG